MQQCKVMAYDRARAVPTRSFGLESKAVHPTTDLRWQHASVWPHLATAVSAIDRISTGQKCPKFVTIHMHSRGNSSASGGGIGLHGQAYIRSAAKRRERRTAAGGVM